MSVGGGVEVKEVRRTRGGHSYTHCTDTRDRDQNLIELIFGLDRLIAPLKKP